MALTLVPAPSNSGPTANRAQRRRNGQAGNLHSRALLCYVNFKLPRLGITDKVATDEVATNHNVQADMGRYRKHLYPKESMARIQTIISATKAHHYLTTLPWLDKGGRILPSVNYLAHEHKMRDFQIEFETAVADFVKDYQRNLAESARLLGTLFDPKDYPDPMDIAAMFELNYRYTQIPSSQDFRVDVSDDAADAIRAQMDVDNQTAVKDAMKDAWERVFKVTKHMTESLRNYKPGYVDQYGNKFKASGAFHSSLVENVRQLTEVLPSLNIGEDPELDKVAQAMHQDLCVFDADVLKQDEDTRNEVANRAAAILENVSAFLA